MCSSIMESSSSVYLGAAAFAAALLPLYYFVRSSFRNRVIRKTTALQDLPNLGAPRAGKRFQGTAVICGGSIAGLWAARVCADHFEDVVIVESEEWLGTDEGSRAIYDANGEKKEPGATHDRARVMQYHMLHIHLPFAYKALKRFCPNLEEEMLNSGVRFKPSCYQVHNEGVFIDHLPYHDYPNGDVPTIYFATRETFERTLRRIMLKSGSRIRWLTGTVSEMKTSSKNPNQVESVSVRTPGNNTDQIIPSSLVIDCTGGTQAGFKWLKRLQSDINLDEYRVAYDAKIRYRNFRFPVPPAIRDRLPIPGGYNNATCMYAFTPFPPNENRVFLVQWLEGHRIEICCGSMGECNFPEQPSDLESWAKSLRGVKPVPEWVFKTIEILRENEHEAVIKDTGKIPACSWIHFEQMTKTPSNFIAIGDAVMRVNPIYGQGCTKACVGAATLDKALRAIVSNIRPPTIPRNFSKMFSKQHAHRIKPLWDGTKSLDYGWDTTIPAKSESLAMGNFDREYLRYLNILLAKADKDAVSAMFHFRMFLGPAIDILHPKIALKVLLLAVKEYLS